MTTLQSPAPHAVLGPGERQLVSAMAALGCVVQIGDVRLSITSLETWVNAHVRAAPRVAFVT